MDRVPLQSVSPVCCAAMARAPDYTPAVSIAHNERRRRWLSTHLDDGRICRELAASAPRSAAAYRAVMYTSDVRGAGTDANVYIHLHGELGDGRRHVLLGGVDSFARRAPQPPRCKRAAAATQAQALCLSLHP